MSAMRAPREPDDAAGGREESESGAGPDAPPEKPDALKREWPRYLRKAKVILTGLWHAGHDFNVAYKMVLSLVVLVLAGVTGEWLDLAVVAAATGLLLTGELFNTAIEQLCDVVSPEPRRAHRRRQGRGRRSRGHRDGVLAGRCAGRGREARRQVGLRARGAGPGTAAAPHPPPCSRRRHTRSSWRTPGECTPGFMSPVSPVMSWAIVAWWSPSAGRRRRRRGLRRSGHRRATATEPG